MEGCPQEAFRHAVAAMQNKGWFDALAADFESAAPSLLETALSGERGGMFQNGQGLPRDVFAWEVRPTEPWAGFLGGRFASGFTEIADCWAHAIRQASFFRVGGSVSIAPDDSVENVGLGMFLGWDGDCDAKVEIRHSEGDALLSGGGVVVFDPRPGYALLNPIGKRAFFLVMSLGVKK